MLIINKNIILNGTSDFDGITAQTYQANIDSKFPENMQLSNWIGDYTLYKTHRTECANERTQFEDAAFELQEQMIEENKKLSMPE